MHVAKFEEGYNQRKITVNVLLRNKDNNYNNSLAFTTTRRPLTTRLSHGQPTRPSHGELALHGLAVE